MNLTPEEIAEAAVSDLRARLHAQYPRLEFEVGEYDYCDRLRVRVRDTESGRHLKVEDLRVDDQTMVERANLVIGTVRDWLAEGRSAHERE